MDGTKRRRSHHVLMLPSWYPTETAPHSGIFFRDQARAVASNDMLVGTLFPETRSLRSLRVVSPLKNRWQVVENQDHGVSMMGIAGWNLGARVLRKAAYLLGVRKLAAKYVATYGLPTVIHGQSTFWGGVAAAELSARFDIPYVITEHSSAFPRGLVTPAERHAADQALKRAGAVVAVSRYLADVLAAEFGDLGIRVIPNIVDSPFFDRPVIDRSESRSLLAVAALVPNKRVDKILRAFAMAFPDENVILQIVGQGPLAKGLRLLAGQLGVSTRVAFLGSMDRAALLRVMEASLAVVSASEIETFGLALAEAQALGVPVIATPSGGPADIILPSTGILAESDVHSLASSMREIYQNKDMWSEQSKRIREAALERFHPAAVSARLTQLYDDVARQVT